MNQDEKIYALIVQAKEMQRFALEFQGAAQDALKTLPDAARGAIEETTGRILGKAENELKQAARGANQAADKLQGVLMHGTLIQVLVLVLVAFLLGIGGWWGLSKLTADKLAKLEELNEEIKRAEAVEKRLAKAKFNECGEKRRLCIRVDPKAGEYLSGSETYMVIHGF